MREQLKKLLTTLTTLTMVLIIKNFGVVSIYKTNLPHWLPQLATTRIWKGVATLKAICFRCLRLCGKW